jgi:hypothetical protein
MTLTHSVTSSSPWRPGDLLLVDAFKNAFHPDFKAATLELLEPYFQELVRRFAAGKEDGEGYPLLEGSAIDFVFRNLVRYQGTVTPIDEEWVARVPADYVLYRCITMDIFASHAYWRKPDVGDTEGLATEFIRNFFPAYSRRRHEKNRELEDGFMDLVAGRTVWTPGPGKLQYLRSGWRLPVARKMWRAVPPSARGKIRRLLD